MHYPEWIDAIKEEEASINLDIFIQIFVHILVYFSDVTVYLEYFEPYLIIALFL